MTLLAKLALLSVVFIDIMGQGLVFPIVDTLVMDPQSGFLPAATSTGSRHFTYGVVIAVFFLSWFFGAPYVSRLSDTIGRKPAILFCLFGALAGYAITIAALHFGSLVLLLVGRAITGFTAGNQPIAQAAMIDGSRDEADRSRNMGYIMTGTSGGLLAGPVIGGVFSDPAIIGSTASLSLPFVVALILVALSMVFVALSFHDLRTERQPFRFRAFELVESVLRVRHYPVVMRIAVVLIAFHLANMTFYIFIDNFMASRFDYGTLGTSMVMLTIGAALALSSTFLVVPAHRRFDKKTILAVNFVVWAVAALVVIAAPAALLCFLPIFAFYFVFGISYPTLLAMFSLSVSNEEQGWVMGITMAVFTFVGGMMSLIGGWLISVDIDLPFMLVAVAALLAIVVMRLAWNNDALARLTKRTA